MNGLIRILHLEDDPADAELVSATLADEGFACEFVRARSRDEFLAALRGAYDVILSDYALPGFDGVSAQRIAHERRPDTPFIFVSGRMGEEVAIDRLKAGATDYVLKHNLARLAPAITRALEEAQSRRDRERVEAEVRRLNAELEQRVADRTAQLAAANQFLDSIVENLPVMLFVKDARDFRFVRFNRAGEEMLGISRAEVIGKREVDFMPGDVAERIARDDRAALAGHAVSGISEAIVANRVHGNRVLHTRRLPIFDSAGQPAYLLGISEDITERRAAEDTAERAKLEAERANRAKNEFLSRMSHDFRTPLNAILGFAQLLEVDHLGPEQADSVRQILSGGRHLLELINEVLDITRIESGHLSLSLESVDVAEMLHQSTELILPLASARGIAVRIDRSDLGCHIRADRQRVAQILLNLLGNAVKYNRDRGTVMVHCSRAAEGSIRISVTDTGAGIPAEQLPRLFQPFERLGAQQSNIEGTGLGLALTKGLVTAMGGQIGVSSEVGRGTTFWIELPETTSAHVTKGPQPVAPSELAGGHTSGTILYIEDNRSNVRLVERVIGKRRAVTLLTAERGGEGIERARREHPDLILLDLNLPDMSGEEVLRRLWTDAETRALPVAVLSADATPAQRHRLLASGAVAYLTKPINIGQLLQLIDERLAATAGQDDALGKGRHHDPSAR